MHKQIMHIIRRAWQLVVATPETWDAIAAEQPAEKAVRRGYVWPFLAVNIAAVFVCTLFYAQENIWQSALINTIVTAVALAGGYYAACEIAYRYLNRKYPQRYDRAVCTRVVSYGYTVVFALHLLTEVVPSLFFLQILELFTGYLVWEACRSELRIPEEERSNIVLVFTLVIIFITPLLGRLVAFMLPNAAL